MANLWLVVIALLPVVGWYAYSQIRYKRFQQYATLPQPPPSFIFGHMKLVGETIAKGDPRRHVDYIFRRIWESLGSPAVFMLDFRPFAYAMCICCSHEVAEQVTRASKEMPWSLPKSPTYAEFLAVTGEHSILNLKGADWKALRKRFNPGFAPKHLLTLLPKILEQTERFVQNMDMLSKSNAVFSLEEKVIMLTFDIIGAVVMDVDMRAQLAGPEQGDLVQQFRALAGSFSDTTNSSFLFTSPVTVLRRWRLKRQVDASIKELILQKYAAIKEGSRNGSKDRSILALSLQDTTELSPLLLQQTADQIKSFLFAGHDTTAIALQWALYELSRSPKVLTKLRTELDELFGPGTDLAPVTQKLMAEGEALLRKMTYTSAVFKETLRLYAPGGTARRAPPGSGFFVRLPDGRDVCLDGTVVYPVHYIIQRDKSVYGDTADQFVPERWLGDVDTSAAHSGEAAATVDEKIRQRPEDDSEGKVPPSAWRPFERGPRNCIGQELANLEARIILAVAVRRYDFTKVGAGELALDEKGRPVEDEFGQYEVKEPLFNTRQVTAKPFDGTMMRVQLR